MSRGEKTTRLTLSVGQGTSENKKRDPNLVLFVGLARTLALKLQRRNT
jgi:hypothetical protein